MYREDFFKDLFRISVTQALSEGFRTKCETNVHPAFRQFNGYNLANVNPVLKIAPMAIMARLWFAFILENLQD